MNKNEPNKAVLNELIDELIRSTFQDDLKYPGSNNRSSFKALIERV